MKVRKVCAIIVTFNARGVIEDCVESLARSAYPLNVIVVDNASQDDTVDYIRSYEWIGCIPLEKNVGFGRANNIGLTAALEVGADFIFLLNQDAAIREHTVEKLVAFAGQNPDVGLTSPIHLHGDGQGIDPKFAQALLENAPEFYDDLLLRDLQPFYEGKFINAAAWFLTRPCVEVVGGFDPIFFIYGEDEDYCRRIVRNNFRIVYLTQARILHKRSSPQLVNATPSQEVCWRSRMRAHKQFSVHTHAIKSSDRFVQTLVIRLIMSMQNMVINLVKLRSSYDDGSLLGECLATMQLIVKIGSIYRHRWISRQAIGPWLCPGDTKD